MLQASPPQASIAANAFSELWGPLLAGWSEDKRGTAQHTIGLVEDVLNGLVDAVDVVGILVGDLDAELLLMISATVPGC